jgi:Ca2+-binding RTX toxin-like protein
MFRDSVTDFAGAHATGGGQALTDGTANATLPPTPSRPTTNPITVSGDMDRFRPANVIGAFITDATDTSLQVAGALASAGVNGTGFTYVNGQLVGGTATMFFYTNTDGSLTFNATAVSFPAAQLGFWIAQNDVVGALSTILAGPDNLIGQSQGILVPISGADLIRGYGGDDLIRGFGGSDTIYGGLGDDVIIAQGTGSSSTTASTYLRGDEGSDYILGGISFDDINGNMGNDTASGGDGVDWVVGGKDNDLLFGDAGNDLVYGNLGNDTCEGGDGADIIRGGQENDVCVGGAGNDFVSGDKGDDTMTGGAGADVFHTFGEAGLDRVTDFSLAQGDRVQLDPGTTYTAAQVGADTVITMAGGGQMVLVGVLLSTLTPGWIFGA